MTGQAPVENPNGLLALLLDVFDVPVVVRVGTTLVNVAGVGKSEGRYVLELDAQDLQVAVEHLVLDSVTAAKARTAGQRSPRGTEQGRGR
jgi:hypothetical protein